MKVKRRFSALILLLIFSVSLQMGVFLFNPSIIQAKEVADPGTNTPFAPENLSATAVSQNQINLSWAAPDINEFAVVTNYVIYRTQGGDTNFNGLTPVATISANVTSYSDLGLSPSTQYNYKVAARSNTGAESGNSNLASATTQSLPATAPSNLTATAVSNSQINLSWTPATSGADLYYIYRKGPSDSDFLNIGSVGSEVAAFSDTGLSPATTYSYKVATYKGGVMVDSNIASATTNANVLTGSGSTIPTIQLTAAALNQTQIGLRWTTISGVDGYTLYRRGPNDLDFTTIGQFSTGIDNHTDSNLMPGTRYVYYVLGNMSGGGIKSNEDNATTLNTTPAINLIATEVCNNKAELSWNAVVGASSYDIYRSVNDTSNFVYLGSTTGNNYSDSIELGKTYYYKVVAAHDTSIVSNVVSVVLVCNTTPTGSNPSATPVINLTATGVCATKIDLSWNIVPGAAYYNVYRSVGDTSNFVYLNKVYTGSYTDLNVEKGKTYNYKVIAADTNYTTSNIIGVQFICDGNPSSGGGIIIVVGGTTGQPGGTSGTGTTGGGQPGGGIIVVGTSTTGGQPGGTTGTGTTGGGQPSGGIIVVGTGSNSSPDCLPSDTMPSVEWKGNTYNNPFNSNSGIVFGVLPDTVAYRSGNSNSYAFRYCWQNPTDKVRRIRVTRQLIDENGKVRGGPVSDVKTLQPRARFTLDRTRTFRLPPGLYKEEVTITHLYSTFGSISLDEKNGFYFKIVDEGNPGVGSGTGTTDGGPISVPTPDSSITPDDPPGAPGTPGIVLERLPDKDGFVPGEVVPFTPAYIPPVGDSGDVVYKFKLIGPNGKEVKLDPPGVNDPGISDPIRGGGGDPGVGDPGKGSRRDVLVRLPRRLPPGTYRVVTEVRRGGSGGGVVDTSSFAFTVYQGSK